MPEFEGRRQGPDQSGRGPHTMGEPLCPVGAQGALNPQVLIQLQEDGPEQGLRRPFSLPPFTLPMALST